MNFAGLANCLNDTKAIHEEFALVPVVHARMDELPPGGETKNRYANVIPLPETRVPMTKRGSDPLSEYINANFVRVSGQKFNIYLKILIVAPYWSQICLLYFL
jgi:protein tyrosine phosphatase